MGATAMYDNSGHNADYISNRKSNLNGNYGYDYWSVDREANDKAVNKANNNADNNVSCDRFFLKIVKDNPTIITWNNNVSFDCSTYDSDRSDTTRFNRITYDGTSSIDVTYYITTFNSADSYDTRCNSVPNIKAIYDKTRYYTFHNTEHVNGKDWIYNKYETFGRNKSTYLNKTIFINVSTSVHCYYFNYSRNTDFINYADT